MFFVKYYLESNAKFVITNYGGKTGFSTRITEFAVIFILLPKK